MLPDYFLRYFTLNLFFANECESISGQAGTSLKVVVNAHIQGFIQAYGERETHSLAQGMGVDNWQVRHFTAKDDKVLRQILKCSTSKPPAWTELNRIWTPSSQEEDGDSQSTKDTTATDMVRGATIEEKTFCLLTRPFSVSKEYHAFSAS